MKKGYDGLSAVVKIGSIKKKDVRIVRILICCGLLLMGMFIWWFIRPDHIGNPFIFWLLTFALSFKFAKMLHEWYYYWAPSIPSPPVSSRSYSVDILTTSCPGEPREMIIRTLRAMQQVRYPHTSYLCDEGNDPVLKEICAELGVVHVTRTEKINAKAGNINNALKSATGEICVVLDPDHVPVPEFLDRTVPYFEDQEVGFVQCVQGYGNQSESIIAKGAAEQTYHFYGPMMMSMNSYGTVQAIGANCTFRRAALDSIGGHAAGLAEDMHTAMQLHAKGWKSVYIPEMLTRGLVPATISSYYKQQLKWSRGTFELLFRTYPGLFKKYTWQQKIHYFAIPLYFLFGLVNLIDILVPVLALIFAQVPWEIDLKDFGMFFIPLCALSLLIRLYSQCWLLEKHERGLQLAGGILRTATWWVFLVGFVYAIFNINVPYIPTPKEDEHQNHWKLSLPNIIVVVICIVAVVYGLSIDWSPYSFIMAGYVLLNVSILSFIILVSQQRFLDKLHAKFTAVKLFFRFLNTETISFPGKLLSRMLRNGAVALSLAVAMMFLSYSSVYQKPESGNGTLRKDNGGFFVGYSLNAPQGLKNISNAPEIFPVAESWGKSDPVSMLSASDGCSIPLISWLPETNDDSTWNSISAGKADAYLSVVARRIRKYRDPVFISFAPGFDKNGVNNSGPSFVKAWQYLYTFFNNLGVSNITWIWSPGAADAASFYPGTKFVDWIGVSCLNYGTGKNDDDLYSFSQLYVPFRTKLGAFEKPFLLTEFGSVAGNEQAQWFEAALADIAKSYPEIQGLVFFDGKKVTAREGQKYISDFSCSASASLTVIGSKLSAGRFAEDVLLPGNARKRGEENYTSPFITGKAGSFKLVVKGKELYIRGIAYNTAHDWRDGNMPLTRRQVEKDLLAIKQMGANTIRRYDHGIYDRNVLNIAAEYDLNVLYGFWFDPEVDYYKDSMRVKEYVRSVEENVIKFRDHKALVGWSLGNETWGLLKHNYGKPYLTKVREAYLDMIEALAKRIHELDPSRPVISCIEHEKYQLPGEISAFRDAVPSLDIIGVNTYYKEQITKLNHAFYQFDSLRPYLVTEFGPRGYWDPMYNKTSNGLLREDNEDEKSEWYVEQWRDYVKAYDGYNVGGIAYCWHDRMEGSNTWFGLTDYRGYLKPSYYALKGAWTNEKEKPLPSFTIVAPDRIRPGESFLFEAVGPQVTGKKVHYQWMLNKNDYLENVDALDYNEDEPKVIVRVPDSRSDYRLYLYVSDDEGNSSPASLALKVY